MWATTAALCLAVLGYYLSRYPLHDLNPVGWDVHAYVWQTRAVGHGSLAVIGARPGLPLLGAALRSMIPIDPSRELVVLPPVLALMLGLVTGAMVRMAFRLPAWASAVVALVISLWPMTPRIVFGYQASLMEQLLLAAGVGVVAHAERDRAALAVGTALFAAGALSHIVFYVVFAGMVGVAAVMALPASLRQRRAGVSVLDTESGALSAAVFGGGVLGGVALFGWLGIRPSSSVDTTAVSFTYRTRAQSALRGLLPWVTVPGAMIGTALAWVTGRSRPARIMVHLGLAWLAMTSLAVLLLRTGVVVPVARFIQFALPLPVLFGMGAVAVAGLVLHRDGLLRWMVGAGLLVVLVTAPAITSLVDAVVHRHVSVPNTRVGNELRLAEAYLNQVPGDRPVVFVVHQRGYGGAFTPKPDLYVIRSSVPVDDIARTFVYVGHLAELQQGRPTLLLPIRQRWMKTFNDTSLKMWAEAKPALDLGAVILIARAYAEDTFAEAIAQDPTREIGPGLYVVRGPLIRVTQPAPLQPFGMARGAASAIGFLVILEVVGWGWARFALRRAQASRLDIAYVAPALGAGLVILASFVVAALGGDPAHWPGIVLLAVVGLTGWAAARRVRRATSTTEVSAARSE